MALGNMTVDDRAGIFAALPNRTVVDRLISRYFNSNDPAMSKGYGFHGVDSWLTFTSHNPQADIPEGGKFYSVMKPVKVKPTTIFHD